MFKFMRPIGTFDKLIFPRDVSRSIFAILILATIAAPAHAGTAAAGYVSLVTPSAGGGFYFLQSGTRNGLPACATDPRWIIDSTTPAGQSLVAVILTAYSLHKQIAITGTGSCGNSSNSESVAFFSLIE